jgi:Derlin-2/3
MSSIENFFKTIPPVTRALLVATFSVTIGVVTHVISLESIFLDWDSVLSKLQIWRVFSEFFYIGPFSISWLFHMYFFVQYSSKLEKHSCFTYPVAQSGSFLYFIILQIIFLNSLSLLFFSTHRKISFCF